MKKHFLFAAALFLMGFGASAQTQQDAVKKTINERYEAASADFKRLIAISPTNGELYFYAGDNYMYWGELDSAETMFRKGTEVAPVNPLNYAGLGRVAWKKNDALRNQAQFSKAIEIMGVKANKVDKTTQQLTYMKMAESYIQGETKKLDEALIYLNNALKINETNPEVFIQLGDYYSEKDGFNLSNALKQYTTAQQLDPKYTRTMLREGQLYVKVKNWNEGLKYFNQAIETDPTFAPAYREKAELLYMAGKYNEAIESYSKYLELNNNCRVQQRYASFIYLTKDYKKAIEEIEKAIPCNPNNAIMYRVLAYACYDAGDYAKGLDNIKKFFEINEKNTKKTTLSGSDYAYYGKLLWKNGQDSLGIEKIQEAMRVDSSYKDGYGEIALIYSKAKRHDKASEYYEKKIENATEKAALDYFYLGQSRYFNKEYALADAAFEKASEKFPDAYFWRGRCNSKLDNQEMPTGMAKPYYETYVLKVGSDPKNVEANKKNLIETYSYLGFFHYTQKNFECSKTAWLKVQELDAANEKAKIALADKDIAAATGTTCVLIPAQ